MLKMLPHTVHRRKKMIRPSTVSTRVAYDKKNLLTMQIAFLT